MNKWINIIIICLLCSAIASQFLTIRFKDESIALQQETIKLKDETIHNLQETIKALHERSSILESSSRYNCRPTNLPGMGGIPTCDTCSFAISLGQMCWDGDWLYYGDGDKATRVTWEDSKEMRD